MVVPGKNMGDNFKRSSGNLGIYIGLGIGLSALIVGIFFLFRFVIFPPEIEEETKSSDIDEILNSIKKENHSESISDAKSAPISVVEVKPQKDNNADNKTAALNEQKIEQKKPVQTTSIKEPPEEKKIVSPAKISKKDAGSVYKFTIQIASYKNPENAKKEMKNLEDKKFDPELIPVDLGDKGTWYRLRAGKYKTQEEAKSGIWELNSIGFKNVVVTPY